jgi:hypothetical protein
MYSTPLDKRGIIRIDVLLRLSVGRLSFVVQTFIGSIGSPSATTANRSAPNHGEKSRLSAVSAQKVFLTANRTANATSLHIAV